MPNGGEDLERQGNSSVSELSEVNHQGQVTIVVSEGTDSIANLSSTDVSLPKKGFLSRTNSSDEECR